MAGGLFTTEPSGNPNITYCFLNKLILFFPILIVPFIYIAYFPCFSFFGFASLIFSVHFHLWVG